jgi:exodeoxyribonuclease VII small subunit
MAAKKVEGADNAESYGQLRARLDEVLLKLQDPDCDVDEAVDLYEQALQLVGRLEKHLETAENRIQKIKADFGLAGGA